jgi:hypothetical protein
MSSPTPTQSFLGGVGLALPVHALLLLNGSVFGVSGFVHCGVKGQKEALASLSGFVLGGVVVGLLEGCGPRHFQPGLPQTLISGFLVGFGSKVGKIYARSRKPTHLVALLSISTAVKWLYLGVNKLFNASKTFSPDLLIIRFVSHMLCGISRMSLRFVSPHDDKSFTPASGTMD